MTHDEWLDNFTSKLRYLIRQSGMSQKELARKAHISEITLSRCVNGKMPPSVPTLINLAYALNCTIHELGYFGDKVSDRTENEWKSNKKGKLLWRDIYEDFKRRFPSLSKNAITYFPHGYAQIRILHPDYEQLIYDYDEHTIIELQDKDR